MSKSLAWALPPREIEWNYPDINKYAIGQYLQEDYNGDGLNVEVGSEIIPFLKGYAQGKNEKGTETDVNKMIEAIENHGKILISIH